MTRKVLLRLGAAIVAMNSAAHAGEAEDLAALKAELASLRSDYDAKIEALEQRLRAAEAKADTVETIAAAPVPEAAPARAPVGRNAYNPAISVVLNGTYAASEKDPAAAVVPGFPLDGEAGLQSRGFSLGESEVAIDANIDHRVDGNLIYALTDDGEVEVEEAYI
ncbi:MAG: hypothetical protein AAB227_06995, partial [Pseudomonadota bacterium]